MITQVKTIASSLFSKSPTVTAALLSVVLVSAWQPLAQAADDDKEKLPFKPGLWEMVMEMNSDMTGPSSHTTEECITEDMLDSEKMAEEMEQSMPGVQCDVERAVDGNSMTIVLSCKGEMGNMSGKGDYRTENDGTTMTGEMNMDMKMQGMEMVMKMKANGKRIGDC